MAVVELDFGRQKPKRRSASINEFHGQIVSDIEDAVSFFKSEIAQDLEDGLRYYNGEVDLPTSEGRSKVVSTQVRDAIRNLKPSILRVLCSSSAIVKYVPTNIAVAAVIEQQEKYVHQLFWQNDGYSLLRDTVDEALKMRMCPVKTYWQPVVAPTYAELTMLTIEEVAQIEQLPNVEILSVTENDITPVEGIDLYDVTLEQSHPNGKIVSEAVPVNEFFISRNATSTDNARVHGHRRSVTVAEAIELGIDFDDWDELDDEEGYDSIDAERSDTGRDAEEDRGDILSKTFLLTEAYVRIDLEDAGTDQLYCLYLGGTSYQYLAHYRETESPFDICQPDPKPFTVYGGSIPDLTVNMQDTMTSLLRSTVDNAHAANRPRLVGDPQKVNFDDLMAHEIDYPIRAKQGAQLQVIAVPSTLQGSLPLLQWLEDDSQNKVGITKAAQGLDPNAMQSTDKDAVKNTIALSQGQVELMVRNIIHSLLIPLFRKMLRLSIQHMDRYQIIQTSGNFIQVDQILFDPTLYAEPNVGLGTADEEKRAAGLQFTLQNQLMLIEKLGMSNPFVGAAQIYNTLEDLTRMFGIHNVGRYFNLVSPEVEQQFVDAKKQEAAEAAQNGPQGMDPAMALVQTEQIKSGVEKFKIIAGARSDAIKAQLQALQANADDDFRRDQMAQDLELKTKELLGKFAVATDTNAIKREQAAPREGVVPANAPAGGNA